MHNTARRLALIVGTTVAATAVSVAPASAEESGLSGMSNDTLVPVPRDLAEQVIEDDGLSEPTRQAWENWNEGGGMVGLGSAQMVSGAWIGVPHSLLDLTNEERELSPATQQAWDSWNEGGYLVGQGAAQMVSGAWIGVPHSILDVFQRASAAQGVDGMGMPKATELDELDASELDAMGLTGVTQLPQATSLDKVG